MTAVASRDRGLVALRLAAALCTAIVLGAGLAHLFALPNKMPLAGQDYLVAQQVYAGWALLGVPEFGALILSGIVAYRVRRWRPEFLLTLGATICIALSLVIFFLFTFPANQQTRNWTELPANWEVLRLRWEYSHAVAAVLFFTALAMLMLSFLVRRESWVMTHDS